MHDARATRLNVWEHDNVKQHHLSTVDVLRATRLARVAFKRKYATRQSRPHGTKADSTTRSTRRITSRLGLNMSKMLHRTSWFARALAAVPSRLDVFNDGATREVASREKNARTMLRRKIILDLAIHVHGAHSLPYISVLAAWLRHREHSGSSCARNTIRPSRRQSS